MIFKETPLGAHTQENKQKRQCTPSFFILKARTHHPTELGGSTLGLKFRPGGKVNKIEKLQNCCFRQSL